MIRTVSSPGRLWLWFVSGFLVVFVGMLLIVKMTEVHPSGQYAVRCPLWQYYVIFAPQLFATSTLGPASGSASTLLETGMFHLLFSGVGDGATAALGWCVRRMRSRGV
jgi:hypothetical protein